MRSYGPVALRVRQPGGRLRADAIVIGRSTITELQRDRRCLTTYRPDCPVRYVRRNYGQVTVTPVSVV